MMSIPQCCNVASAFGRMHLVDLHGNLGSNLSNNPIVTRCTQIPAIYLEFPPCFIPKTRNCKLSSSMIVVSRSSETPKITKTRILPGPHPCHLQPILAKHPACKCNPTDGETSLPQPKFAMQIVRTRLDPHYSEAHFLINLCAYVVRYVNYVLK
jgi:hypothetical protein